MGSSEVPDDDLVCRHRTGDAKAFPLLIERWGRRIYGFICTIVRDQSAADDVYQETLLNAWQALAPDGLYKPRGVFRTWLFRIAYNASMTHHRRHVLRSGETEEEGQQAIDLIPSREDSPEKVLLSAELRQTILECMQQCLTDVQRAAFILVDLEEMKFIEAAAVLGVPLGTVISRVDRSRKQLRECLRERGIEL